MVSNGGHQTWLYVAAVTCFVTLQQTRSPKHHTRLVAAGLPGVTCRIRIDDHDMPLSAPIAGTPTVTSGHAATARTRHRSGEHGQDDDGNKPTRTSKVSPPEAAGEAVTSLATVPAGADVVDCGWVGVGAT